MRVRAAAWMAVLLLGGCSFGSDVLFSSEAYVDPQSVTAAPSASTASSASTGPSRSTAQSIDAPTDAPTDAPADAAEQDATPGRAGRAGPPARAGTPAGTPRDAGRTPPHLRESAPPPPAPLTDGPPDYVYSYEQLLAGDLGGKILHGARPLFSYTYHDSYLETFPETRPYLVGNDINLGNIRFTGEAMVKAMAESFARYPREVPVVSILYTRALPTGKGDGLDKQVVEGMFDEDLVRLAAMLKGFGRPAFVRIASEFNGDWNGYHLRHFAASFRHIVDLFRGEGVDNAIFMWNYMPLKTPFPYLDWYPGDDYVDWWSVDVYDNVMLDPTAGAELHRYLDDAEQRGKPVLIAESGPSTLDVNDPATWDRWFEPYFRLINDEAHIKAFLYSNVDLRQTTVDLGWKDVRLAGSAMVERYQAELRKPQYQHQR